MIFKFLITVLLSMCLWAADPSKQVFEFPGHLQPIKEFFASLGYETKESPEMAKAILKISKIFFRTSTPFNGDTAKEAVEILKNIHASDDKNELDEFLYKVVAKPHGSYKGYGRSKEEFLLELNS